jgi:glycerol-3-phosphate acyltransferase PlsX
MRIVLDAMGSDHYPEPEVGAANLYTETYPDKLLLTGPETELGDRLSEAGVAKDRIELIHAADVLEMTDKPAEVARAKPENSMAVGMRLLKNHQADAFVTAGNTGGAMANALFTLGRIRGIKRPALSPILPVAGGHAAMIDVGANAECRPEYLVQFGLMGSMYAKVILGIESPRVGLLSNGEEPGKGNDLVKASFPLLESSQLNFIGNIEPKEFFGGAADVAITDGFTGNVFIKTSEAIAKFLFDTIRNEIKADVVTSIGGALARPAFRRIAAILDPDEYGAIPLLGVNGLVFVGHGRSDTKAMFNALRAARRAVEGKLLEQMTEEISAHFTPSAN